MCSSDLFSQNFQNEFDHLIKLEDELEQLIDFNSEIDGHDIGKEQMNINEQFTKNNRYWLIFYFQQLIF